MSGLNMRLVYGMKMGHSESWSEDSLSWKELDFELFVQLTKGRLTEDQQAIFEKYQIEIRQFEFDDYSHYILSARQHAMTLDEPLGFRIEDLHQTDEDAWEERLRSFCVDMGINWPAGDSLALPRWWTLAAYSN